MTTPELAAVDPFGEPCTSRSHKDLVEPDPTRICPTCGTTWIVDIDFCSQCGCPASEWRPTCGKRVGPIWKLDGETCVCIEPAGHVQRQDGSLGVDHVCSCGAWFVDEVAHG